jgi:hypothetical protein
MQTSVFNHTFNHAKSTQAVAFDGSVLCRVSAERCTFYLSIECIYELCIYSCIEKCAFEHRDFRRCALYAYRMMSVMSRLQLHLSVWRKAVATWIPPTSEQRSIRARFCHLVHIQDWEAAANMQVNNECDAVERVLDVTTESDR